MSAAEGVILLVEDEPIDALLMRRAFAKANLPQRLEIVSDGTEAVAYLAGRDRYADRDRYPLPVLLLLDLKLPTMSGFEVLEWIRSQSGLKRLPVVVLTSSRESADVNRSYELGANSFLVKPVAFDALLRVVGTLTSYWMSLNEKPDVRNAREQALAPDGARVPEGTDGETRRRG
jgi:CheY-like chemotaxis protein